MAVGVATESPDSAEENEAFLADRDLQIYWTEPQSCGVAATYVVTRRLGRACSLSEVADQLPVGASGTSMAELTAHFDQQGLSSLAVELTASDLQRMLRQHPGVMAIGLVNDVHWVAVETTLSCDVRAFEYPEWHCYSIEQFDAIFSNKAVLVNSSSIGATIRQTYWIQRVSVVLVGLAGCIYVCAVLRRKKLRSTQRNPGAVGDHHSNLAV